MVGWQVTATTILCDAVDADVTLMVYKDGLAKCIAYSKYGGDNKENWIRTKKKKDKKVIVGCEGPECSRVIGYRDKIFAEEKTKAKAKTKAKK